MTSAEHPTISDAVGRIMDKAQIADREALFAALQAAVGRIINTWIDRDSADVRADLVEVERRLDHGRPYGR